MALLALWEDQEPSLSGTPYHQAALALRGQPVESATAPHRVMPTGGCS